MSRPEVLSSLEAKVDPHHTALLVIDMANDLVDPDGKTAKRAMRPIEHARSVIPVLKKLVESARNAGVMVVFIQHTTMPDSRGVSGAWLDARSRATYSVEDLCVEGTWGQQVIQELQPSANDVIVRKYRYSGFTGTNLEIILRSSGIRAVVCAGVSTNVCVEATARDAFSHDLYVMYAADACGSWDKELHDATLRTAGHRYATVVDSAALIDIWALHQKQARSIHDSRHAD
jgi:ureidoacrylate peracid hydrolase